MSYVWFLQDPVYFQRRVSDVPRAGKRVKVRGTYKRVAMREDEC